MHKFKYYWQLSPVKFVLIHCQEHIYIVWRGLMKKFITYYPQQRNIYLITNKNFRMILIKIFRRRVFRNSYFENSQN